MLKTCVCKSIHFMIAKRLLEVGQKGWYPCIVSQGIQPHHHLHPVQTLAFWIHAL